MRNSLLTLLFTLMLMFPAAMPSMAKSTARAATSAKVDINSASFKELDDIKGIGPKTAAKIIAGRPYKGKDDLLSRKIVNKGQYAMIRDYIVARQGKRGKK